MGLHFYSMPSAPISIVLYPADCLMTLLDILRAVPLHNLPTTLLDSRRSNPLGSRPSCVKVAAMLLRCSLCGLGTQMDCGGDACYRLPLVLLCRLFAIISGLG